MLIFILIQSCEHDHDIVRANAVKLFHCLAEDGDNNIILEHVGQRRIETLLKIIKTSNDGSDCCRPNDPQITMWLLDAGAFQIVAEAEIIPMLVQLLVFGTALTKQSAAISLKQLSKSLSTLSSPANALEPLVRMLGEADLGVCEASLDALLTLVDGQRIQSGSKVLAKANAIVPIIKLLSSPSAT
ncbi:hypothetical protein H0E87_026315, partial [Populus deltoides]